MDSDEQNSETPWPVSCTHSLSSTNLVPIIELSNLPMIFSILMHVLVIVILISVGWSEGLDKRKSVKYSIAISTHSMYFSGA